MAIFHLSLSLATFAAQVGRSYSAMAASPADDAAAKAVASSDETANAQVAVAPSLDALKRSGWLHSRYRDLAASAPRPAEIPQPKLAEYEAQIKPILANFCVDCHGPDTKEGNVQIDTLDPNLHTGKDVDWWNEIFAVIGKGEMPPPDSEQLSEADRKRIFDWLSGELQSASIVRRQSGSHSAFRRLTRYEFDHALQDLLGLPWNFAKDLPPEPVSPDGFLNSSDQLHMSVSQFETYQRLARTALKRATVRGDKPQPLRWGLTMGEVSRLEWPKLDAQIAKAKEMFQGDESKLKEELDRLEGSFRKAHPRAYFRHVASGCTAVANWDYSGARYANAPNDAAVPPPDAVEHVAILPAGQAFNIELGNLLPDEGVLRVRVRASRTSTQTQRLPSMELQFGWQASNEGRALLRVSLQDTPITAKPGSPEFYQWDIPLGEIYPRNSVRDSSPMGAIPSPSEYIRLVNSSASPDEILIDYVEVLAPVYDQWPPESHRRIFDVSAKAGRDVVAASQDAGTEPADGKQPGVDPHADAAVIIRDFVAKAWRRSPTEDEVRRKLELFEKMRPHCESFEEAIVEVLASVLASPQFLYVVQDASDVEANARTSSRRQLTPTELATRLSLFVWCSIPDPELLEAAESGQLANPQLLQAQVQRMLADPRSHRFAEQFVQQWLDLERLEFINFEQHVGGFDPLLKEAMRQEPVALFSEMLTNNESVLNFIHADYTMANERLARHYGIDGVLGNHFRRVRLDGDFRRGGLLTQAGPLAMNSDYPDSHPLKRGKWLLESLLNDPPPPPPPAVPQIDLANPEIAKMTLKERIEDHRNHPACISCHIKIDPWGIAFENYDALGKWRDQVQGKPVDASSELFNHQTLDGMEGLKRFLLQGRQDQFVAALVHKMTTFAIGRPLTFADRADLDAIAAEVRHGGDGLATMVTSIVSSEPFRSK